MITQNKTPYCLGIKNTKNQKIANTTGGWKLTYLQSWDKADLSHWKRFHFRNPLRRPQSWNEQLSLLLRPRPRHHIIPHNTLDISHPVLVHFSQSIPQPILRERYEDCEWRIEEEVTAEYRRTTTEFSWWYWGNQRSISKRLSVTGVSADLRTGHLPNRFQA